MLLGFIHPSHGFNLLVGELLLAATLPAAGSGGLKAGPGSLTDQVSFKRGQGAEDMEAQFAAVGGGVQPFLQAREAYISVFQLFHYLDQVLERPAQPIQPPDHQAVTWPGIGQRLG